MAGAFFLFTGKDEEEGGDESTSAAATSESADSTESSNSSDSSDSSTSTSSSSSSSAGGYASADNSVPSNLASALPSQLGDLVYDCEEATFNLEYTDDSAPNRTMKGATCKGAKDAAWKYSGIDIIEDKEYAENVVLRVNDAKNHEIVSDEKVHFAAMEGPSYGDKLNTLVVVNQDKGVVLEAEYISGGEESMREVLKKLGFDA